MKPLELELGATPLGSGRCRFRVWSPFVDSVEVHVLSPPERMEPLRRDRRGYYSGVLDGIEPGALYLFRLNGSLERPDPASRFQPQGVHGPSQVADPAFDWTESNGSGPSLQRYIIYELHVGAFTVPGTFDAAVERLDDLTALGITAVELMPVAQFPGERNWGYDGVFPFAAQNSYGGPQGLKRFVNACHARGLAVVLDVVYNHLGPEGNYLRDFAPYFSDVYRTPWGASINFDGPYSDEVRRYFIENALYWLRECRIDALRLDAVHAILDFSAQPFLRELAVAVARCADELGRRIHLIAESALNDTRLIRAPDLGGFGLDAQWSDDLHHSLHAVLTGEQRGYYCDFGGFEQLLKALREGFVYDGQYSKYRKRRHGNSGRSVPSHRLVVSAQNHDQVGNRMHGDRLSGLVPFEALKLAAGVIMLSPNLPLLFMGEEYGETAPFPYFVSHSDPALVDAVRRGRRAEFASFGWEGHPPDPQAEETFRSARLDPERRQAPGPHRHLWEFHRRLITLRRDSPVFASSDASHLEVSRVGSRRIGTMRRWDDREEAVIVFHAGEEPVQAPVSLPEGHWEKVLDSAEAQWSGPGSAVPGTLVSEGEVLMELSPYAFLVLFKADPER
jgi:maltooligosyltrehalose trehalohydrolase